MTAHMSKFKIEGEMDPEYIEDFRDAVEQIRGFASVDKAVITIEAKTVISVA